jgi:hypothetical protein
MVIFHSFLYVYQTISGLQVDVCTIAFIIGLMVAWPWRVQH